MVDSLYIKNYRNLQDLTLNSLARINLITGANNTGKSTLLETVAIYASKGNGSLITRFLKERGETFEYDKSIENPVELNAEKLTSMFYNWVMSNEISIRDGNNHDVSMAFQIYEDEAGNERMVFEIDSLESRLTSLLDTVNPLLVFYHIQNEDIKIGVWIMPNNDVNGMLEDFISFLVPQDDKLLSVVDNTLSKIEENKLNKYTPVHKAKARIHTWLSWQENPGIPMGQGITKGYLTVSNEVCVPLVNWLKNCLVKSN